MDIALVSLHVQESCAPQNQGIAQRSVLIQIHPPHLVIARNLYAGHHRRNCALSGGAGRAPERFSLHRIGFGLFLITAFSLGLAAVLVTLLTIVYAKRVVASRVGRRKSCPSLSALFIIRVYGSAGYGHNVFRRGISSDVASPFLGLSLQRQTGSLCDRLRPGLFLGMWHPTDPDHVVAFPLS